MPTLEYREPDYKALQARRIAAEKRILAKYPNIIVGSSGWNRAMANQMRK